MHGRLETTRGALLSARRSAPAARCALPRARGRVRRCPGSVPPSTSPLSEPPRLCLCLCPPPPRLRLPPLRASAPAGRTGSEARRSAGCRAGGGRGPSRGRRPGAGGGRPGLSAGPGRRRGGETERGGDVGGGEECGDGGGGGDSARGAELETEVTEAGLWKAGLGIQRAGRGRSVPPTPDAQPAFSAPTYPRERPAGDILTPTPPSPPRGERSFTTTHRYTKTPSSAKDGHTRLNSYADACCPHLNLAVLYL